VVDKAVPHERHRLKAAVRVLREAGHVAPVVHVPARRRAKVGAKRAAAQRLASRAHRVVARRVLVVVVHRKDEGVDAREREAKRRRLDDRRHDARGGDERARDGEEFNGEEFS
jgi:hypothetical protein